MYVRFATLFKNGRGCSKAKKGNTSKQPATHKNTHKNTHKIMAAKTMDEWDAILAAESSDDDDDDAARENAKELTEMLAKCVRVQERMTKLKTLITEVSEFASEPANSAAAAMQNAESTENSFLAAISQTLGMGTEMGIEMGTAARDDQMPE